MSDFEDDPQGPQIDRPDFSQFRSTKVPITPEQQNATFHNAFQTPNLTTDPTTGEKLWDTALGAVRGPYNAARDAYSLVDHVFGDALPNIPRWEANTTWGAVSSDLFQIAAGFWVGSSILNGVGIASKLKSLGVFGKLANFGLENASASVFFENHHNLSNLLSDKHIGEPLSNFLAIGPDDWEATARLKNALEGVVLTPVISPLMHGLGFVAKQAKAAVFGGEVGNYAEVAGKVAKELQAANKVVSEPPVHLSTQQQESVLKGSGFQNELPLTGELQAGQVDPSLPKFQGDTELTKVRKNILQQPVDLFSGGTKESVLARGMTFENLYYDAIKAGSNADDALKTAWPSLANNLGLTPDQQNTLLMRLTNQSGQDTDRVVAKILSANDLLTKVTREVQNKLSTAGDFAMLAKNAPEKLAELHQTLEAAQTYIQNAAGMVGNVEKNVVAKTIPTKTKPTMPEDAIGPEIIDQGQPNKFGVTIPTIKAKPAKYKSGPLAEDGGPAITPEQAKNTDFNFGANVRQPPDETKMYSFPWIEGIGKKIDNIRDYIASSGGTEVMTDRIAFTDGMIKQWQSGGLAPMRSGYMKFLDMTYAQQVGSLLTNIPLQMINATNNIWRSFWVPGKQALGAALTGDMAGVSMAGSVLKHTAQTYLDMLRVWNPKAGGDYAWKILTNELKTNKTNLFGHLDQAKIDYNPISAAAVKDVFGFLPGLGAVLDKTPVGKGIDVWGKVIQSSGSLMKGMDDMTKFIVARANILAGLEREAAAAGLDGAEKSLYITDKFFNKYFRNGQFLTHDRMIGEAADQFAERTGNSLMDADPETVKRFVADYANTNYTAQEVALTDYAKNQAQNITFTEKSGPMATQMKRFTNNTVVGATFARPFIPLISTIANVIKNQVEWPFGVMEAGIKLWQNRAAAYGADVIAGAGPVTQKFYTNWAKEFLSTDKNLQARAIGHAALGMGLLTAGWIAADNLMNPNSNFRIIGSGPQDPVTMALWKKQGHRDHTIEFGPVDKPTGTVPYNRTDDFGIVLSMLADGRQYAHFAPESAQKDIQAVWGGLWAAFSKGLTEQTFYRQAVNVIGALSESQQDGLKKVQMALAQTSTSYIPKIVSNLTPVIDGEAGQTLKELRSTVDVWNANTPWGNPKLMPKRDALGDTIQRDPQYGDNSLPYRISQMFIPIMPGTVKDDPVRSEMVRLNHPWDRPSNTLTKGGITMDLTAYTNDKGQTAHDRWSELVKELGVYKGVQDRISKPDYKNFPQFTGNPEIKNQQIAAIQAVLSQYQQAALVKLLQEYPQISKDYNSSVEKAKPAIQDWQRKYR